MGREDATVTEFCAVIGFRITNQMVKIALSIHPAPAASGPNSRASNHDVDISTRTSKWPPQLRPTTHTRLTKTPPRAYGKFFLSFYFRRHLDTHHHGLILD